MKAITLLMISETTEFLRKSGFDRARVGIIMGTGLGEMVSRIESPIIIPYSGIPNFPEATVEFHKGNLIYGSVGSVKVIAMQGRFHYYEGYSMQQITFPVRVMKELGIEYLLLSNVAGGMNPGFKKGDIVITEDHLNFLPDNPLRGLGNEFGNRFTDMSEPYSPFLREKIVQSFQKEDLTFKKGVYVSVMGPNLETKAEYRWLRNSGADMVGMSTVPEVIVANQVGIQCAAVSVITDECDPENLKPVNIPEIITLAGEADKKLTRVFYRLIMDEL